MTGSSPRLAAPDTTGELRKDIAKAVAIETDEEGWTTFDVADAVLALPALRALIAERDTAVAQVQAVRELAAGWDLAAHDEEATRAVAMWELAEQVRRALDGVATTGGGE